MESRKMMRLSRTAGAARLAFPRRSVGTINRYILGCINGKNSLRSNSSPLLPVEEPAARQGGNGFPPAHISSKYE